MKIRLKCKVCGKTYSRFPSQLKSGQRRNYCSGKCSLKARRLGLYKIPGPIKKGKFIKCLVCGNKTWAEPNEIKRGKKYCSKECLGVANGNRTRGKRAPWVGKPPVLKVCKICNKEFSFYESQAKRERGYCCSRKCADKWHSLQLMGEKNCNWRGGTTRLQIIIRNSAQAKTHRWHVFKRDGRMSILSGKNGNIEHHHLTAISFLIRQYGITKNNWVNFKHILFDDDNAVTLTKEEHDKFHNKYGKMVIPEQFEEFRQKGGYL